MTRQAARRDRPTSLLSEPNGIQKRHWLDYDPVAVAATRYKPKTSTDFEMPLGHRDAIRSSRRSAAGRSPDRSRRASSNGTASPPWMWTLAYGDHEDRTPRHGYETTRQAARRDRPYASPFGT